VDVADAVVGQLWHRRDCGLSGTQRGGRQIAPIGKLEQLGHRHAVA